MTRCVPLCGFRVVTRITADRPFGRVAGDLAGGDDHEAPRPLAAVGDDGALGEVARLALEDQLRPNFRREGEEGKSFLPLNTFE